MRDLDTLPMYTTTFVLGAGIGVAQQDTMAHDYSGHRTRETAVRVEPYEGKSFQQRQRIYLAAWARRTLFSDGDRDGD